MPPVPRLGKSLVKIHRQVQPWPVSPRVAQIQLGPKGRKGGRGWDGAGKGTDAAGGAAACPRGARLNGGDRGAARGCGGCPGVGLGWQHQPQLRDTLTRPKAGEAAGPPHCPTAHPGGGETDGMGGAAPTVPGSGERFGGALQPQRGKVRGTRLPWRGPTVRAEPQQQGGRPSGAAAALEGGTGSATMASPHILKPHPTLCATGWHCWTPALGSLRHRNVYFSKFFVFVLFRFVFFFFYKISSLCLQMESGHPLSSAPHPSPKPPAL